MSTQKNLDKMLELEEIMKIDLNNIHPASRGGWGARIREAQDAYPAVWDAYRNQVMTDAVAIFVSGNPKGVAEFREIAEDMDVHVVDSSQIYSRMADIIDPMLGEPGTGRQLHPQHVGQFFERLRDVSAQLNVDVNPSITQLPILKTYEDTFTWIREAIRGSCGDAMNRVRVAEEFAAKCKEERHTEGIQPVVVVGCLDAGEVEGMSAAFGCGHIEVNVSQKVIKPQVISALKKARDVARKMDAEAKAAEGDITNEIG